MSVLHPAEVRALARARQLALNGRGRVSPNPLVGAVVLDGDRTIAEGWHEGPGLPHAEAMALALAGEGAHGATVVCTLEPCSHFGRTPPCAQSLVDAGVARVVIGCLDPLERGRAGGRAVLEAAGIDVALAPEDEAEACRELIAPFLTWGITGRPLVALKLATSLDGKVATSTGESQWISGAPSRRLVHRWRADHDAVGVGIGTALADDPGLTARDLDGPVRQPTRVVFDGAARLPIDGQLARSARAQDVVVVAGPDAPAERVSRLRDRGVVVEVVEGDRRGRMEAGILALGARGLQSLFIEGGAALAGGMIEAGVVDRVAWFLAPILIGGVGAPSAIGGAGVDRLAGAPRVTRRTVEVVGDDILVQGWLRPPAWEG